MERHDGERGMLLISIIRAVRIHVQNTCMKLKTVVFVPKHNVPRLHYRVPGSGVNVLLHRRRGSFWLSRWTERRETCFEGGFHEIDEAGLCSEVPYLESNLLGEAGKDDEYGERL